MEFPESTYGGKIIPIKLNLAKPDEIIEMDRFF